MSDTRPVWLSREQRDALEAAWPAIFASTQVRGMQLVALKRILDDWDAAPADATEASVRAAEKASPWADNGPWPRKVSAAVLHALGMPGA